MTLRDRAPAPAPLRLEARRVPARGPAGDAAPPGGRPRRPARRSPRRARSPATPAAGAGRRGEPDLGRGPPRRRAARARVGRRPARARRRRRADARHRRPRRRRRRRSARRRSGASGCSSTTSSPGRRSPAWPPASAIRTCSSPGTRSSTCGPASSPGCSASTPGPTSRVACRGRTACAGPSAPIPTGFWPQLRNRVRTYADLRPELVGAVERLIDFVAPTLTRSASPVAATPMAGMDASSSPPSTPSPPASTARSASSSCADAGCHRAGNGRRSLAVGSRWSSHGSWWCPGPATPGTAGCRPACWHSRALAGSAMKRLQCCIASIGRSMALSSSPSSDRVAVGRVSREFTRPTPSVRSTSSPSMASGAPRRPGRSSTSPTSASPARGWKRPSTAPSGTG